jgi:hypothetical protein
VFIVFLHPCHAINPRREIAGRIELTAIVAKGASKMGHLNRACAECDEWVVSRGPLREPAPDRRSRAEGREFSDRLIAERARVAHLPDWGSGTSAT